jgi:pSer/pThr/pTyr-binding forkhead associated (FHA) protein
MQESSARFVIEHAGRVIPLTESGLSVGRGDACDLSLRDSQVSRLHARVSARAGAVLIEDLGSRNGVFVNGKRVHGAQRLELGDVIMIGLQRIELRREQDEPFLRQLGRTEENETQRPPSIDGVEPDFDGPASSGEATQSRDALELLASVAAKLAASGHVREAEQVVASRLADTLARAEAGERLSASEVRVSASAAVMLAEATDEPKWIDYVFALLLRTDTVIESVLLERIHTIVRGVPRVRVELLSQYIERLDALSLTPAERFVLRRLHGLEAVARTR